MKETGYNAETCIQIWLFSNYIGPVKNNRELLINSILKHTYNHMHLSKIILNSVYRYQGELYKVRLGRKICTLSSMV